MMWAATVISMSWINDLMKIVVPLIMFGGMIWILYKMGEGSGANAWLKEKFEAHKNKNKQKQLSEDKHEESKETKQENKEEGEVCSRQHCSQRQCSSETKRIQNNQYSHKDHAEHEQMVKTKELQSDSNL